MAKLLKVVGSPAGELDDLRDDLGVESDQRFLDGFDDRPSRITGIEGSDRQRLEEPYERLVGRSHPIEQARRRSHEESERQVGRIELESARSQPQEHIAGHREQVNVIEEHDYRPPVASVMLDQPAQCRAELALRVA